MNNSIYTATVVTEKNRADKKMRSIGIFLLPLLLLPCAANATIFKCVVADSTVYSATPCASNAAVVHNTVSIVSSSINTSPDNTDSNQAEPPTNPNDHKEDLAKSQ